MYEIELNGLDGGSLLGFLAALGTLRILTLAADEADVRMRWTRSRGWIPVVHHSRIRTGEQLTANMERFVCGEQSINPAWEIGKDLTLSRAEFRTHLLNSAATCGPGHRESADFLTAFGSEAIGSGPKKEQMSDSEFRTMSGAGHQHFLGSMKELAVGTDSGHLARALFAPWDYADSRPSLRWDAADYRPHALRAEDPSGDPIKTMRGANRLAVEALPLFSTVPRGRQLRTVAFEDRDGQTEVTWPIWSEPLRLETVASLIALDNIQEADFDNEREQMRRRNIVQVFRAKRFTEGKYRNFSPARALL